MPKYKVFFMDRAFPDSKIEEEVLSKIDAELVVASAKDVETLVREGANSDAIFNVYLPVPTELIDACPNCKVIVRTGIGYETIPLQYAGERGIYAANVPDYCIGEVADHTVLLYLSVVRKVPMLNNQVKSGVWKARNATNIPRLQGMVFGIFGFGNIAKQVARRLKAFGMQVMAYDPYLPDEVFAEEGVIRAKDFDTLVRSADGFSMHVPLNEETQHIFNVETFRKMKPGAIVVNTARGGLIGEEDLIYALENGLIAGAGLDVLEKEPPDPDNKLLSFENVVITPHSAFASNVANIDLRRKSAEEIVRTLTDGKPKYCVNKKYFKERKPQ